MSKVSHITAHKSKSTTTLTNRVSRLIAAGVDVLSAIKGASEGELRDARRACASLGWRTEVAFDAELVNVAHARRGRGNLDKAGVGVKAAIRKQAEAMGVSTSTIKLNVRIFNTFLKNGVNNHPILTDKGYFQAALRTKNPTQAIEYFETKVKDNRSFSVTQAMAWAERKRCISKDGDDPLAVHIRWAIDQFNRIKNRCPNQKFADRFYKPLMQDLEDHLAFMSEELDEQKCRLAWDKGYYREGQLVEATGLSKERVSAAMLRLSEQNEFWLVQESTHGRHDKRWQKAGVPLGNFERRAG